MKGTPLILLLLTCCATKQQSSESFLPKDGSLVVETIQGNNEYFDGIRLTADSTLENGSFNELSVWKDGRVVFSDHNSDGRDTLNFSAFRGMENKVRSELVFYYEAKQAGYLFVKGADYGCCVPNMTVVKVDGSGFTKIFDEAFYVDSVRLLTDGDARFYGIQNNAEAIPADSSSDTLISAYNPTVVLSLSNDLEMDSSATKAYNESEYVFAGYKYSETVKVVYSRKASFKPYIYENAKTDSQEDCVFDNDIRKLTSDWLRESGVRSFIWDDKNRRAIIAHEGDSIFASQGGCEHFGMVVERKLAADIHPLEDRGYWVGHALKLAEQFGLDFYAKEIRAGNIRNPEKANGSLWYEIGDDDPSDNLYYNGIEIRMDGKAKIISISQYYN
jgi:hypothetical protein